jgi:hypothetical protein
MRPSRTFDPATTSFGALAATNVSSNRIAHIVDDIFVDCNPHGLNASLRAGSPAIHPVERSRRAPPSRRQSSLPSVHYEILIPRSSIRNRKLTRRSGKERAQQETIMLDVAFVALGVAVLALMGVYALALRQL